MIKTITKLTLASALAFGSVYAVPASAQRSASSSDILIVDTARVFSEAKAAKDGAAKLQKKLTALQGRAKQLNTLLEKDAANIKTMRESKSISQQELETKAGEWQRKRQTYVNELRTQQVVFKKTETYVQKQIMGSLTPILERMMKEKNGMMVLNRQVALAFSPSLDITSMVISRLDRALPTVSVNPPAGAAN